MHTPTILVVTAALALAAPPLAQDEPAKSNEVIKPTHTVNDGGSSSGANSFTRQQAREHIASSGFTSVSSLAKDAQGVWRGTARKDGRRVHVSLDFNGNVFTGE